MSAHVPTVAEDYTQDRASSSPPPPPRLQNNRIGVHARPSAVDGDAWCPARSRLMNKHTRTQSTPPVNPPKKLGSMSIHQEEKKGQQEREGKTDKEPKKGNKKGPGEVPPYREEKITLLIHGQHRKGMGRGLVEPFGAPSPKTWRRHGRDAAWHTPPHHPTNREGGGQRAGITSWETGGGRPTRPRHPRRRPSPRGHPPPPGVQRRRRRRRHRRQ